jgi:hypothetical protein
VLTVAGLAIMATDAFTELLWNYLCVPRQADGSAYAPSSILSHGSSDDEVLSRPGDGDNAGFSPAADLGSLPPSATGGPVIDPSRIEAGSGALAYLREVQAFINIIQHTADGSTALPSAAGGYGSLHVGTSVDAAAFSVTAPSSAASTTDQTAPSGPGEGPGSDAGPGVADPADDSGPDASQFMWIGNADAAQAIAEACAIDPGLSHVMGIAGTTIQSVLPGPGGIGAVLDAAASQVNWNAQFNILADGDSASQSMEIRASNTPDFAQMDRHAATQDVSTGGNGSTNEAALTGNDAGYDLIIVTGNYYEYNIVLQVNIVFDNDLIRMLFGGGSGDGSYESTASAGGNSSVNEAGIVKAGLGAPLLLGGEYHQTDALLQYSFLSDMDVLKAAAVMLGIGGSEMSYDLLQSILAGGNSQQNGLSVNEIGTDANLWSLDSLGALKLNFFTGEDSLDALLTLDEGEDLAPGTLYVDGDYAEVNVLVQVNVVFDSDTIDQDAMAHGNQAGQDAAAGGNNANNAAYIIDTGSSAVLVVAGDYYESNTVIQANFIQDNDTVFQDADTSSPQHVADASEQDDAVPHGVTDSLYSMSA